jgi:hypothetical protein
MPKIHHVENFVYWLTREGKLIEILTSGSHDVPVVAESLDENHWPYYNYAFVHADQQPSAGVIKGMAIPDVVLVNGQIQERDREKVASFVQAFGVSEEVATRVLVELVEPKSYCRCAKSISEGAGSAFSVTFSKNLHGDVVMWIRETVDTEADELVSVEWNEVKGQLPAIAQLERELAARPHAHLTYNTQTVEWQG